MKQLTKLVLVLLGLLLMTFACQKDNVNTENQQQIIDNVSYKKISLDEIEKLKPVVNNIKKMSPKVPVGALARDFSFLSLADLDTENIIEYTDTTGYSTWTFKINGLENTINFENLHLLETDEGYVGYILSYEPVEDWYNNHLLVQHNEYILGMSDYQGEITKYSLDREVIWSSIEQSINNSSASRAGQFIFECTVSIQMVCTCNQHEQGNFYGCNCLEMGEVETCQSVWSSGGGSSGNNNNSGGDNNNGGSSSNDDDCGDTGISGTVIQGTQPIAGIGGGCAPNVVIGIISDAEDEEDDCDTSKEDLKKVFANISDTNASTLASVINDKGKDFGIDSKEKLHHFLSQAGHEVGGFNNGFGIEESTTYTTKARLLKIFGKYYSETDTITKRKPDTYINNASGHANYVYCCRMGNGNEDSGDGYKYRGRGIFQLTGKTNYTDFKTWYNDKYDPDKDFVSSPELLKDNDTIAILSALWYYKTKVLDKITIDSSTTVKKITKKVNGGTNGLTDRKDIYTKAKDSIDCK